MIPPNPKTRFKEKFTPAVSSWLFFINSNVSKLKAEKVVRPPINPTEIIEKINPSLGIHLLEISIRKPRHKQPIELTARVERGNVELKKYFDK